MLRICKLLQKIANGEQYIFSSFETVNVPSDCEFLSIFPILL